MKLRYIVSVSLLTILLIISTANIALAGWSALNSGYAVTTTYHGIEVPLGQPVIATAGTTDALVTTIVFTWLDPDGNLVYTSPPIVPDWQIDPNYPANVPPEIIDWAEDNPTTLVGYAQDTLTLNIVGDWTVKIECYGPTNPRGQDQIIQKATSFFVVDEVPLGTIITLAIPIGFLSFVAIKKKRTSKTK